MRRTKEQVRVGGWMRYAARRAGMTAEDIRRALGLKRIETVYRWWSGDRAPRGSALPEYARVVGRSLEFFYQAADPLPVSRRREPSTDEADLITEQPMLPAADLRAVSNEDLTRELERRLQRE